MQILLHLKVSKDIYELEFQYLQYMFNDFQSNLSNNAVIAVEKDCNFKMFNFILENRNIGLLRLIKNELTIDEDLTKKYLNNENLPNSFYYALMSPYIDYKIFPNKKNLTIIVNYIRSILCHF